MSNVWKMLMTNMKREKLLSVSNILVMTVTFLVFGLFILTVAWSQTALRYLEQQVQVSVFFKDEFTEPKILELKTQLEADKRISSVRYISKEEAFKIFSEINKDEPILLQSITPSILPASLEVKAYNIGDLSTIASELNKNDGVEEVRFFKDVVDKFKLWSGIAYIIGFVLVGVLLVISYSVIIATLRTTITTKGVELEIMKLVGATDKYVKSPLIMQGVFFGLISSLIPGLIILLIGFFVDRSNVFATGLTFGFLPSLFVQPFIFSIFVFILMLVSGLGLGYFGSIAAVKKYLKY